jgi:hypothetical protein
MSTEEASREQQSPPSESPRTYPRWVRVVQGLIASLGLVPIALGVRALLTGVLAWHEDSVFGLVEGAVARLAGAVLVVVGVMIVVVACQRKTADGIAKQETP